jgi:hypothetical protein
MGVHCGLGMDLLGKGGTRTLDPGIISWSADQYATEIRKIRVHLFRCGSLRPEFPRKKARLARTQTGTVSLLSAMPQRFHSH